MNASEFAFKSYVYEELSNFKDWTQLSPSDWICLLSEATHTPGITGRVIDALCDIYAPYLADAKKILFYYNPKTSMQAVVDKLPGNDLSGAQSFGWAHDVGITTKKIVHTLDKEYAYVFATYDKEHKIVALSVSIERCE